MEKIEKTEYCEIDEVEQIKRYFLIFLKKYINILDSDSIEKNNLNHFIEGKITRNLIDNNIDFLNFLWELRNFSGDLRNKINTKFTREVVSIIQNFDVATCNFEEAFKEIENIESEPGELAKKIRKKIEETKKNNKKEYE